MTPEIKKIYWITHPAFALVTQSREHRRSKGEINQYVDRVILSIIRATQQESDSLVVLVRTPREKKVVSKQWVAPDQKNDRIIIRKQLSILRRQEKRSGARERTLEAIESKIETALRALPHSIVVDSNNPHETSSQVIELMRKKGIQMSPEVVVERLGSWKDICARDYPAAFAKRLEGVHTVHWHEREGGTIPRTIVRRPTRTLTPK